MRLILAVLIWVSCLGAEFLRVDVAFEDIGCASCLESLQGRLERVRGVERGEIDAPNGLATVFLTEGNRVRLAPLLARVTQDGTKILRTHVEARGAVATGDAGLVFTPSGLTQSYRLNLPDGIKPAFEPGLRYRVKGEVTEGAKGEDPALDADSVDPEAGRE